MRLVLTQIPKPPYPLPTSGATKSFAPSSVHFVGLASGSVGCLGAFADDVGGMQGPGVKGTPALLYKRERAPVLSVYF